jgi:hypothetical protein
MNLRRTKNARAIAWALLASAACVCWASSTYAQGNPTGTLTGTISDPSGGLLPEVSVTAVKSSTVGARLKF